MPNQRTMNGAGTAFLAGDGAEGAEAADAAIGIDAQAEVRKWSAIGKLGLVFVNGIG